MKINELRGKIANAEHSDLEKIIAEVYKQVPKAKKEDLDQVIDDILEHRDIKVHKKVEDIDFDSLKTEMEIFLDNVFMNYYVAPNRVVPKAKRSKWRFEVKNYVKQLIKVPLDGSDAQEAADLIDRLYKCLCRGCGYYMFPSEDPFNAIGISQQDFYKMVVTRFLASDYSDEKIKNLIHDATSVFLDRNTLHIILECILVDALPTSDMKYKAIEMAQQLVDKYEDELLSVKKYSDRKYYIEEHINELCNLVLGISISLGEGDDGVKYYWLHAKERSKEIVLYCILDTIRFYDDYSPLWIRTYEKAVKGKVVPRDSLKEVYKELVR
ncbi:hypothetical protein [Butyrivibrio sp. AE3006]|uniref:hypothetical protein n=1 Tax=Butyrivibrio sp. AE3006 TaxID=1280673 RepID=UPI000417218E|nr:hypothetical protein [Butyrivibrio sp. AE3006]